MAVEADSTGSINLLSWDQAAEFSGCNCLVLMVQLTGAPLHLSAGSKHTYDAEFLFNLDLNNDGVQGRNTSRFDEGKYHRDHKLTGV